MKIKKFKVGDIITRVSAITPNGDRSYMGDELEFVGVEKGLICLVSKEFSGYRAIKVETDWWSEGWDYFPIKLWKKTLFRAKEKTVEFVRKCKKK